MGTYKLLPHTADVRILAKGKNLPDLFETALNGLCNLLYPDFEQRLHLPTKISLVVESIDSSSLLVDFLNECLLSMHLKKALFYKLGLVQIDDTSFKGFIHGYKVKEFVNDVKAVSYHEAYVKTKSNRSLEGLVVIDI